MQRSMALLALVSGAAAQLGEPLKFVLDGNNQIDTTPNYHYLGTGRGAEVRVQLGGQSAGCYTVNTVYALKGRQSCARVAPAACGAVANCIPQRVGEEELCVAVEEEAGSTFFELPRTGQMAFGTTFQYKSHGDLQYEWFVRYSYNRNAGCTDVLSAAELTLAIGKAYQPQNSYCVGPFDVNSNLPIETDPDNHPFFAHGAELPRHQGIQYAIESRVVSGPGNVAATDLNEHALQFGYFDLGKGPMVDLRCVRLHVSSLRQSPVAGCEALDQGFGTGVGISYDLALVDAPDCRESLYSADSCCRHSGNRDACVAQTPDSCTYVQEVGECYSTADMTAVDLKGTEVVTTATEHLIVSSSKVNQPDSSLLTRVQELKVGWSNRLNRRWFLRFNNQQRPSTTDGSRCQANVEMSYVSHTTGGICEPSARALCDATERRCQSADKTMWGRFWKQFRSAAEFGEVLGEDEYHTCNCLKQKEVCYRKNGCLTTKRYELILQNCQEAGCGNVCNSGAAAQASLLVLLFAVLALLL